MADGQTKRWSSDYANNLLKARNTRTVEEAVVHIVEEKLARYKMLNNNQLRSPIDLDVFASLCGITSVEYAKMKQDARLVYFDGKYYVQVNTRLSRDKHKGRRRFSIAHEIGHKILAASGNMVTAECEDIGGPNEVNEEEQLCDLAAKQILLLSEPFLNPILQKHGVSLWAIQNIKVDFEVSFEAATRAFIDLTLGGVAIFYYAATTNPQLPKNELQLVRYYKSDDLTVASFHAWIPAEESCISECFRKTRPTDGREKVVLNNGEIFEADIQAISRTIYVKQKAKKGVIALISNITKLRQ